MKDKIIDQLVVNRLSRTQYNNITPSPDEVYIIEDKFDNVPTQNSVNLVNSGSLYNEISRLEGVSEEIEDNIGHMYDITVLNSEEDKTISNALNILHERIKVLENVIDTLTIDPHPSDPGNVFYMDLPKVKTIYKGNSFTIDFGSYYNNEYVEPTVRINNVELNDEVSSNYIEITKYDSQYVIKGIQISSSPLTLEFYQKVGGNIVSNIYTMKLNINDPNITEESPSAEPSLEPSPINPSTNPDETDPVTDPTTSEGTQEADPTNDINPSSEGSENNSTDTSTEPIIDENNTPTEADVTDSLDPSEEPKQNTLESALNDYENNNI